MVSSRSGNRRHRVELQSPTTSRNAIGEAIETFSTYTTVWASVLAYGNAGEETEASAPRGRQSYRINIRYNSAVDLTHQVIFDSRTFEINAIDNHLELNKELTLDCTELF